MNLRVGLLFGAGWSAGRSAKNFLKGRKVTLPTLLSKHLFFFDICHGAALQDHDMGVTHVMGPNEDEEGVREEDG